MELAPEHRLVVGASGLFFVFWNERFEKERKVFEFFFLLFFNRSPPQRKNFKKKHTACSSSKHPSDVGFPPLRNCASQRRVGNVWWTPRYLEV